MGKNLLSSWIREETIVAGERQKRGKQRYQRNNVGENRADP